eukprot:1159348-Pelagomonas_calceolata.AAC.2
MQFKGYLFEVLLGGSPAPPVQIRPSSRAAKLAAATMPIQQQPWRRQQSPQQPQQQHPPLPYSCHPLHTGHFFGSSSNSNKSSSSSSSSSHQTSILEWLGGGMSHALGKAEQEGRNRSKVWKEGENAPPCYCLAFESTLDAVRFCHASQASADLVQPAMHTPSQFTKSPAACQRNLWISISVPAARGTPGTRSDVLLHALDT